MKKRIFCALILCVLLLLLLPLSVAAESGYVYDRGNLLTEAEEQTLEALASQASKDTECPFYLVTHNMSPFGYEYWGEDFLDDQGLSQREDTVVLIITKDGSQYFYDLYLYGNADKKISETEVNVLLDDLTVYDNLKSGKLYAGCEAFLSLGAELYNTVDWGEVGTTLAIVGVLAVIAAGITCFCVYRSYTKTPKSVDYPLHKFAKLELTEQADIYAGSFVTKRIIQTSSGGSRGGGGGSRGGGAGHAGGR